MDDEVDGAYIKHGEMKKILGGKPVGKRPLANLSRREDTIKSILEK
jgi:hypothetical protein